jgi:hypothetical protein
LGCRNPSINISLGARASALRWSAACKNHQQRKKMGVQESRRVGEWIWWWWCPVCIKIRLWKTWPRVAGLAFSSPPSPSHNTFNFYVQKVKT